MGFEFRANGRLATVAAAGLSVSAVAIA